MSKMLIIMLAASIAISGVSAGLACSSYNGRCNLSASAISCCNGFVCNAEKLKCEAYIRSDSRASGKSNNPPPLPPRNGGSSFPMPVPGFPDIGKNVWEIFRSGYHYGKSVVKISITSKSEKNVQLSSNYSVNCDASQADSSAEAKMEVKEFGSIREKWSSDGTITLEYGVDGKPITGLSITTALSHNPSSSVSGLNVGAKFKNDHVNLGCSVSNALDTNFRLIGAAVFGFKDLFFGYQTGYDTGTRTVTMNDVGLSYSYENLAIHLRGTSIPHECGVSLLYKVNPDWDTAINGIIARRDNRQEWTVGVGTRMKLDEKTMLRLKLNKDRQMGTSIQQKIYDFVTLTLSFNLDLANLSKGDHKVGLAVDIDAS